MTNQTSLTHVLHFKAPNGQWRAGLLAYTYPDAKAAAKVARKNRPRTPVRVVSVSRYT